MSEPSTRRLSEIERLLVESLVSARARVARIMTALVVFLDASFCLRLWLGSKRSNQTSTLMICAGVTAALALMVWYFGWTLVRKMRQDLANGVKSEVKGPITRLVSANNAYKETVTSVTIEGVEMLTKTDMFASAAEGQTMVVEYLPLSKVALSARSVEPRR